MNLPQKVEKGKQRWSLVHSVDLKLMEYYLFVSAFYNSGKLCYNCFPLLDREILGKHWITPTHIFMFQKKTTKGVHSLEKMDSRKCKKEC